ncbi:cyclodeaminase/cyclohydrolase family protein [Clostridium sp. DL1XJH146]
MQKKLEIHNYMDELYSANPIPGGGSAAALTATTAASLCGMVFSLTINKKAFSNLTPEIKNRFIKNNESLIKLKDEILIFMDKDGEAFMSLMNAFKLPKTSYEELERRKEAIQKGYEEALQVPLELIEKIIRIYDYIFLAAEHGNKNVISDAGAACILLHSAIETSLLNIRINLNGIKDEVYLTKIKNTIEEFKQKNDLKKIEISNLIDEFL